MNKLFLLFACMVAQNLNASQAAQIQTKTKHIFEQFEHERFVEAIPNLLLQIKSGRNFLLRWRISEIVKENSINKIAEDALHIANFTYIASSLLYEDTCRNNIEVPQGACSLKTKRLYPSLNILRQLVAGIAALEAILIEPTEITRLPETHQIGFERTRVHDLYLLKTILEKDNCLMIKDAEVYSLPAILAATNEQWPPQQCQNIVHPTSAYTVVKEALEQRKARNIDVLNQDEFTDHYTCQTVQVLKQVPQAVPEQQQSTEQQKNNQ